MFDKSIDPSTSLRAGPLDAHIDAVARQMSAARPRGDMRQRTVARIIAADRPQPRRFTWQAALGAALVFAGVLIAILHNVSPVSPPVSPPAVATAPPIQPRQKPAMTMTVRRSPAATTPRRARIRVETPNATQQESIARLQFDPITVQPIVEARIDVPQDAAPGALSVPRLTLAPLSSEGEK